MDERNAVRRRGQAAARAIPRSVRPLLDPVVWILAIAGVFDLLSGNPVHAILLFAAAGLLGWHAVSPRPQAPPLLTRGKTGPVRAAVLVAAGLVYAVTVGGFARYSWPATAAILVPGLAALWLAWRGPLRHREVPDTLDPLGAGAWLALFVSLGLFELTQLLLQPSLRTDSYAHPTLSVMSDPALATHPGRAIALFVWLAIGWFVIQR
ncbi:MAG TPA: hypothetical protein VGH10_08590 [Actinomycetota bacterium]